MALWTDIIDPATLTGYARAELDFYESRQGSLARWLPNRTVPDTSVRFVKGASGLIDTANFRAYDAEIEIGRRPGGQRVTLELPALGLNIPISEYDQLRMRGGVDQNDARMIVAIQNATATAVRAVADSMERLRGIVLATGKATIDQPNFKADDDFGRPANHTITLSAANRWADPATDRLTVLENAMDIYRESTGEDPGCFLMSNKAYRAFASGNELATLLTGGGSRRASVEDVNSFVSAAGLPPIVRYDRRVQVGGASRRVLPEHLVLALPAPVEEFSFEGTDLGATFWGQTLTSTEPGWGIEDAEQPGIVSGVYKNEKPPMIAEVISDAIGLPVLANANRSLAIGVLAP